MGIISTLLSGGALIGKICQGLSKAFGNAYVDEETGIRVAVADTEICGVKFFQSSESNGGTKNYVFNSNTNYEVSVIFPNDPSGNGVAYDLPATTKVNISSDLSANHSPDKEILVGPSSASSNTDGDMSASRAPMMKLSFNNMAVGGSPVYISNYKISCDTSGIKVNSGSNGLGALKYFDMMSDTGVLLSNQSSIEANADDDKDYVYSIDLGKFGLKKGDILNGQIHIEISGSDMVTAFDNTLAEPLTKAEERALRALGVIE
ncbi:MAG: hypothetical protein NC299_14435 [Lachnospiraceae bacterium]|nr:hypothetical protein [Ruminococcus sp.]MCM1276533.1 hypothetical protein [Lachnospiraceae bacterium]